MALNKGTNSHATVAEGDAYFADRLDADEWTSATEEMKGQALVTATSIFEYLNWAGVAVSESQDLAFPRVGSYFDPRVGTEVEFGSTTPDRIIRATFELAFHFLSNDGILDDTGRAVDVVVGPIKLNQVFSPNLIPSHVKRLINPMLVNAGSNIWWRAN